MIGNRFLFVNIEPCEHEQVTYGDRNRCEILGKRSITIFILPILHDILYVSGLQTNLISLSQICEKKKHSPIRKVLM